MGKESIELLSDFSSGYQVNLAVLGLFAAILSITIVVSLIVKSDSNVKSMRKHSTEDLLSRFESRKNPEKNGHELAKRLR